MRSRALAAAAITTMAVAAPTAQASYRDGAIAAAWASSLQQDAVWPKEWHPWMKKIKRVSKTGKRPVIYRVVTRASKRGPGPGVCTLFFKVYSDGGYDGPVPDYPNICA
jgi:hypothetical protein